MKRIISLALALIMLICAAPFGLNANAASVSDLTFKLINGGTEYEVSRCDYYAQGDISIPSTYNGLPVTGIGDGAFFDCDGLKNVYIPNGVTYIGSAAFYLCDSLVKMDIPACVTAIGFVAFGECNDIEYFNVDEDNSYYSSENGVLFNKDKTELIVCPGKKSGRYVIPDSVSVIWDEAFYECFDIESVIIPEGVSRIENLTFWKCGSMTSISIPASMTYIGCGAFAVTAVTDIYYSGTRAQWNAIEIGDCNEQLHDAAVHFEGEKETGFIQLFLSIIQGIIGFLASLLGLA